MKFYTKEWYTVSQIKSLAYIFNPNDQQLFIVLCDDSINTPDVQTLVSNLDLPYFSEKEKQLRFIPAPVHFPMFSGYDADSDDPRERSFFNDFKDTYNHRLQYISLLPENIQKQINDKNLLALGYAPPKTKKMLLSYLKKLPDSYSPACKKFDKEQVAIQKALSIPQLFKSLSYVSGKTLSSLLDESKITNITWRNSTLHLEIDEMLEIVLTEASIAEEDESPVGGEFIETEVYKHNDYNELHLLLKKQNSDFIERTIYATYRFKGINLNSIKAE